LVLALSLYFAGEPELAVAVHCLERSISVFAYHPTAGGMRLITTYGDEYAEKHKPVCLLFSHMGHYDLLVPC
jgi:hypothetical protein